MIYTPRLIPIFCATVFMVCSLAAQAEPGVTDSTVTVGMSAPFSGSDAGFGTALKTGAETYLRYVNENGGIHGRKIQLLALDDADDPSRTVENTKKMTDDGSVLALMSYYGTATAEAVLPLLNVAHMPLIGVVSGADSLRDPPHRYLFNLRASYQDEADVIVLQLDSQGLNRIAIFYQNDSTGRSGLNGAKNTMLRLAVRPTAIASIEPGTLNVGKAAAEIAASNPVEAIRRASKNPTREKLVSALEAEYDLGGYQVSYTPNSRKGSRFVEMSVIGRDGRVVR